jgi:2'-5' RNA ligase
VRSSEYWRLLLTSSPPPDGSARGDAGRAADSLLLNVAIIPPASVAQAVIGLGAQLPADAPFVVDGENYFPHLTVFMARFAADNEERVADAVATSTGHRLNVEVQHDGFRLTEGNYYEVSYERSERLLRLHRRLLRALKPLRYRPGQPIYEPYFGLYSREQRRRARRTGYDLAGRLYRPHITVGLLKAGEMVAPRSRHGAPLSFTATDLGLFQADQYGAARKRLRSYDL